MRNIFFLTLFFGVVACQQQTKPGHTTIDSVLDVPTDANVVNGEPTEEELKAEYEKRAQELEYKTADPSYKEKDLTAKQYIFDEDNQIALRWTLGKINDISFAVYVIGDQIPVDEDAPKPDNLNEIITKMGKKHLLLLVNDKELPISDHLIAEEIQVRLTPSQIGSFVYKDDSYLLIKLYSFSFTTSGSGTVNLLINIRNDKVWEIETRGEVLFKSLIDTIENRR